MNRGDVVLARFPHPAGGCGKKRPVVVVQADVYTANLRSVVVAEVTKNLSMAVDPACLLIDISTPEGQLTGLKQNSVVSGLLLATLAVKRMDQVIGKLSGSLVLRLDSCLRAALGIP